MSSTLQSSHQLGGRTGYDACDVNARHRGSLQHGVDPGGPDPCEAREKGPSEDRASDLHRLRVKGPTSGIPFLLKDATAASAPTATYDLRADGLEAHVGHKVEVTGPAFKSGANRYAVLWAKNLKMIANKCS
jgi:hypothetical protein